MGRCGAELWVTTPLRLSPHTAVHAYMCAHACVCVRCSVSKAWEQVGRLMEVKDGRVFERLAALSNPGTSEVGLDGDGGRG